MTGPTHGPPDPTVAVDLEIDCRGLTCPQPVIELARQIDQVPVGGVAAVTATDVAAGVDVPAWCRMRQHDYLGSSPTTDGAVRHLVRRRS